MNSNIDKALTKYMELTLKKNEVLNLTAIRNENDFRELNIEDSLFITNLDEYKTAEKIADLGSGAGLPGIPLSIFSPDKSFYLIESVGKKTKFLEEVKTELNLNNIEIVNERIELIGKKKIFREQFDLVLARALKNYIHVLELAIPLVKLGGYFLAYKTNKEFLEYEKRIMSCQKILGFKFVKNIKQTTTNDKIISVFKKTNLTNVKYPRDNKFILSHPLVS